MVHVHVSGVPYPTDRQRNLGPNPDVDHCMWCGACGGRRRVFLVAIAAVVVVGSGHADRRLLRLAPEGRDAARASSRTIRPSSTAPRATPDPRRLVAWRAERYSMPCSTAYRISSCFRLRWSLARMLRTWFSTV